jgi:hypothetical protein
LYDPGAWHWPPLNADDLTWRIEENTHPNKSLNAIDDL